jgi:hypothetical protein
VFCSGVKPANVAAATDSNRWFCNSFYRPFETGSLMKALPQLHESYLCQLARTPLELARAGSEVVLAAPPKVFACVEIQFLAVLDDNGGFIVNAVYFANLLKVLVLRDCIGQDRIANLLCSAFFIVPNYAFDL